MSTPKLNSVSPEKWCFVRWVTSRIVLFFGLVPTHLTSTSARRSYTSVSESHRRTSASQDLPKQPVWSTSDAHMIRCVWSVAQRSLNGWISWIIRPRSLPLTHFFYSSSRRTVSIQLAARQSVFSFHTVTRILKRRLIPKFESVDE